MSSMHMVIESYKHNSCQSEHGRGGRVQMAVYRRVGHNRAGVAGYIGHHVHIYIRGQMYRKQNKVRTLCVVLGQAPFCAGPAAGAQDG